MLDYFALIVLIVLIAVVIAGWVLLAMAPGQIARKRNHPQADAINVMGWWGAITMGILSPIAWVWAYTKPVVEPIDVGAVDADTDTDTDTDSEGEGGVEVTS